MSVAETPRTELTPRNSQQQLAINGAIGWQPQRSLVQIIDETIEYFRLLRAD